MIGKTLLIKRKKMSKTISMLFFIIFMNISFPLIGQNSEKPKITGDSLYQSNIKKTRLYGVYIPKDIPEAMTELDKLSTSEAKDLLKKGDETTIGKKLRFGVGRWMEYNWNFQEGSRLSHHLREKGLWHMDDMVEYMIVLYQRHVKSLPLYEDILAEEFIQKRKILKKKELDHSTIDTIDHKK
jgi:hypothetical protein